VSANPRGGAPAVQPELAAAAEWLVIIRSGEASETERQQFEHWLQSSPSHLAACRSLEQTFLRLPDGLSVGGDAVRGLLLQPNGRRAFMRRSLAVALTVTGSAAWVANGHYPLGELGADLATATGQQRTVELPDGTVLRLCARTAVDRDDGGVRLRLGALALDCAGTAPQVVAAAGARMVVTGPGRAFATQLESGGVLLGVVDAVAQVVSANGSRQWLGGTGAGAPTLLEAGADGSLSLRQAKGGETAWLVGMIEAHDERLDELVAGLRRFDQGLILVSEAVAGLRLSGRYSLHRLDDTFAAMADTAPVSIRRVPGVLTLIDKA